MLSIPNYCRRNANQKDNKKSNPTSQMASQNGHSHKSKTIYVGESREERETPQWSAEGTLATATRTDSFCMAEKKNFKRANPRI